MRLRACFVRLSVLLVLVAVGVLGYTASAFAASEEFKPSGGAEQEFVVPAGVTHIEVSAVGGAGHAGRSCDSANEPPGGAGAKASAQLTVKPGQKLYVDFGGGGAGGNETVGCGKLAGAGGDASDVREEPGGNVLKSLQSRLLVAGGGGGGGGGQGESAIIGTCPGPYPECARSVGGAGASSGSTAQAGKPGEANEPGASPGGGGEGGGSGSGGKGGSAGNNNGAAGSSGMLAEGGAGAAAKAGCQCGIGGPGGGGGGGYYGGGGGGSDFLAGGGGGAGSSLIPSGGTLTEGKGEAQKVLLTYRADTTLTTSLSGEGKLGEMITVKEGEGVTDQATLSGENASKATGKASYKVYSDSQCSKEVTSASEVEVASGKVPVSETKTLVPGIYYWRASYLGDENNEKSVSKCGSEVLTVTQIPKSTTLSTLLYPEEGSGSEKLTVKEGTRVSDVATLGGENASKATGKVSYKVYSDSQCSKEVTSAGEVEVASGKVPASETKTLAPGTYYWQASYSGDEANEKSVSECGAEVETVTQTLKPTKLTTSLSGEGNEGEKITVKQGAAVTDRATLSGENASTATGTATYNVYGDSGCTKLLGTVSSAMSGGKSETSPLTFVEAGTYYWQVSYSGDENNQGSEDKCGAEVLTVTPKPATSTCGKTTVGKSSAQLLANFKRVNQCTLPVNATLSEISIYLTPTSHPGTQLIKGIVYGDSKGKPTGLFGTTVQLTFTSKSKAGWYHLAFAMPLKLPAGNYWIGMITGASQNVGAERYDSVANAQDSNTNSYTAGASKSFGAFNKGNEQMSLYATYTAG